MTSGTPISRPVIPTFNPGSGLRSPLDKDDLTNGHKKNKVTNASTFGLAVSVARLERIVAQLRRRVITPPLDAPPQTATFFPFKVYQPPQSAFPANGIIQGTTFDPIYGTPTAINIDSTKPTNFGANPPTVNPTTDYFRLWLVRNGCVEVRSYFSVSIGNDFSVTQNNYSEVCEVFYGTDGVSPGGTGEPYDSTDNTGGVGEGFFETDGEPQYPDSDLYGGVLVVPGDPEINGIYAFGLWIEITPDTTASQFVLTRIKGWRWSDLSAYNAFPTPAQNPFIIPLAQLNSQGYFLQSNPMPLVPTQILNGHVINRWPASMYNYVVGSGEGGVPPTQAQLYGATISGAMNYRGDWDNDPITEQMFYPGDFVRQQIGTNEDDLPIIGLFVSTYLGFASDPSSDSGWIGLVLPND